MKRIVFVAAMAVGFVGLQAQARAQDEDPTAEGEAGAEAEAGAEVGAEGEAGVEVGGEAGAEAGGGMDAEGGGEGEGGGDMEAAPKQMRFGVAAVVALPIAGDVAEDVPWTDFVGFGIGVVGGVTYMLNPKLALAGHLGLVYHFPKEVGTVKFTMMEIPILVGVRYMVTPQIALGADTGLNMMRVSSDADGAETASGLRIPLRIGGDYFINQNLLAGAGLWISNLLLRNDMPEAADELGDKGMLMQLEAHVGYMF